MRDMAEQDAFQTSFTTSAFLGLIFASVVVLSSPERQDIPNAGF
ncbi:MAG: hypothetical protein VX736_04800 [Candidatus Neomarinimicrobiota bacterium]|jgi:hypothetical protein|nr:hypothetical protein [Candidatus Neomarinimicrobiota bacterium]